MFSLEQIQEQALAFVDGLVSQTVEERAIPDVDQLPVTDNGNWSPFVTVQFGIIRQGGPRAMTGARDHQYHMPINIQVTAQEMGLARKVANRILDGFLGASFDWAGNVQTAISGVTFPMKNSDGAIEAYIAPLAFSLPVQLATIP